jgi:hypothetical protein
VDITKDTLLRTADTLLGEARRARKLSAGSVSDTDRVQLLQDAEELERRAARLEKDAASAKNGVFVGLRQGRG